MMRRPLLAEKFLVKQSHFLCGHKTKRLKENKITFSVRRPASDIQGRRAICAFKQTYAAPRPEAHVRRRGKLNGTLAKADPLFPTLLTFSFSLPAFTQGAVVGRRGTRQICEFPCTFSSSAYKVRSASPCMVYFDVLIAEGGNKSVMNRGSPSSFVERFSEAQNWNESAINVHLSCISCGAALTAELKLRSSGGRRGAVRHFSGCSHFDASVRKLG